MTNDYPPAGNPDDRRVYCSRSEAIELAMSAMLWSHAVVMVATLVVEILLFGPVGVWIGLAAVAGLLVLMPVVVLPTSYFIGWLSHRLFATSTVPVEMAIRVLSLLFEVNLLGWVVFASLSLPL